MEILPSFNSITSHQITSNFCTCHNSKAVMSWAKIWSKLFVKMNVITKQNFHKICIAMEKKFIDMGPRLLLHIHWKLKSSIDFVVTGGTVSCHIDNLRCHQWWQSCQIDNLLFSVICYNIASLALVQQYDYPRANDTILKNMGKYISHESTRSSYCNHNKTKHNRTMCIFYAI